MLTLDGIETTEELVALLGLHCEWCPTGAHVDTAGGCQDATCHRAFCHDVAHSYRRYSLGSERGHYVKFTMPIHADLVPYAEGPIRRDADGTHRLVTGQRWIGERYALPAPAADWLFTLHVPGDLDTRYIGLCDDHWQERLETAEIEWKAEVQRIRSGAPSLAAQLARADGDWSTLDQLEAEDRSWLCGDAPRYRSLLDVAHNRGWLRIARITDVY